MQRFLEARHCQYTHEILESYIERTNADPDTLLLGLFQREDGVHIGNIKLGPIHRLYRRAYIGIIIGDRTRWGQGLAREAIEAMSDYALGPLGLHRVEAGAYGDHVASMRAFLGAGFTLEARLKDMFILDGRYQDHLIMSKLAKHD